MKDVQQSAYKIPGDSEEAWKELLSYIDVVWLKHKYPKGFQDLYQYDASKLEAKLEELVQSPDNPESQRLMRLFVQYNLFYKLDFHKANWKITGDLMPDEMITEPFVKFVKSDKLHENDKVSLVKAFMLSYGYGGNDTDDAFFDEINLSVDQRENVKQYFKNELIRFLFHNTVSTVDEFKEQVKDESDKNMLWNMAYKVIGSRLLRYSIKSMGHTGIQPVTKKMDELYEYLRSESPDIKKIQNLLIELIDDYMKNIGEMGFTRYVKSAIDPLNYLFSGEKRFPRDDELKELHIRHGGGLNSIVEFLTGQYFGYQLELPGTGIQVHHHPDLHVLNTGDYDYRTSAIYAARSKHFFFFLASFTATIEPGFLDFAPNY
jgi:hypothetical protein